MKNFINSLWLGSSVLIESLLWGVYRAGSSLFSDKLDEILAAAQQTISTNETPAPRGQAVKRERGRGFYNEVCIFRFLVN